MAIEDDILAKVNDIYNLLTDGSGIINIKKLSIYNSDVGGYGADIYGSSAGVRFRGQMLGAQITGYDALQLLANSTSNESNGRAILATGNTVNPVISVSNSHTGDGVSVSTVLGIAIKATSAAATGVYISGLRGVDILANATEAVKLTGNTTALYATSSQASAVKIEAGSGRSALECVGSTYGVKITGTTGIRIDAVQSGIVSISQTFCALELSSSGSFPTVGVYNSGTGDAITADSVASRGLVIRGTTGIHTTGLSGPGINCINGATFNGGVTNPAINVVSSQSGIPGLAVSGDTGIRVLGGSQFYSSSTSPAVQLASIYNGQPGLSVSAGSGAAAAQISGYYGLQVLTTNGYGVSIDSSGDSAFKILCRTASEPTVDITGGIVVTGTESFPATTLLNSSGIAFSVSSASSSPAASISNTQGIGLSLLSSADSAFVSQGAVYGASFIGVTKDIDANELDGLLKTSTVIDTVTLENIFTFLLTMTKGKMVKDDPIEGQISFYAQNGTTKLFTVNVTDSSRTPV